jgi:hypothetical protein
VFIYICLSPLQGPAAHVYTSFYLNFEYPRALKYFIWAITDANSVLSLRYRCKHEII